MRRGIDPATIKRFASALQPGSVLGLLQPVAGKFKFHVTISIAEQRSVGFIINTRPSRFIMVRPELVRRQVPLLLEQHPFMKHDSFIACHDTVKLPTRDELIDMLILQRASHLGRVASAIHAEIAFAAAGSPLIAERDSGLIVKAFSAPS